MMKMALGKFMHQASRESGWEGAGTILLLRHSSFIINEHKTHPTSPNCPQASYRLVPFSKLLLKMSLKLFL